MKHAAQAQKEAYAKAQELFDAGKYEEAIHAFTALGEYEDSVEMVATAQERLYQLALDAFNAEDYETAQPLFEALIGYRDSRQKAADIPDLITSRQTYQEAMNAYNSGKYTQAKWLFNSLGHYKDSQQMVGVVTFAIIDKEYNNALSLLEQGDYKHAYLKFRDLADYKDRNEKIKESIGKLISSSSVGDEIPFGKNGFNTITWILLSKSDDSCILFSKNDQSVAKKQVENADIGTVEATLVTTNPHLPDMKEIKTYKISKYVSSPMRLKDGKILWGDDLYTNIGAYHVGYYYLMEITFSE